LEKFDKRIFSDQKLPVDRNDLILLRVSDKK
jgi:hypothetical protein